jgi:hypothetical protein
VKNVADALEALKPTRVHTKLAKAGVKAKDRNKRKNAAYIRQGEWFFIPCRNLVADNLIIHHDEPIQRGKAKPHVCEELTRVGGFVVWTHPQWAPEGVGEEQANKINKQHGVIGHPPAEWKIRVAEATVYVRGYVKHPDHATIHLQGWHRVYANTEDRSKAGANLRFLD